MSDQSCNRATQAAGRHVDLDHALTWVDQDRELLAELVGIFLQDYPERLTELREALIHGDAPRVQRVAHGLKGAVAGFGAKQAKELARVAEHLSTPAWQTP